MKHKVSELEGAQLARAVAMACGYRVEHEVEWDVWLPPEATPDASPCHSFGEHGWRPDKNWAHGGPIIERERITVSSLLDRSFQASWHPWETEYDPSDMGVEQTGPTYLIAAMRAYVASKLGEEVDLP
jgi:hypothetical protein